jgi:beta-galactosidase
MQALCLLVFVALAAGARQRVSLDLAGWLFQGVTPCSTCNCPDSTFQQCTTTYNDSNWRALLLPHDFVVEGNFSSNQEQSHGYLPRGAAWYRLHYTIPSASQGQSLWVDFDGVYRQSKVYLNGKLLGEHDSGYTSFRYDITSTAIYGGQNVFAVYADASHDEGWWYEGGGIYRHVWLTTTDPTHILPWGVYASANVSGTITDDSTTGGQLTSAANVHVNTEVINTRSASYSFIVTSTIKDAAGNVLGTATDKGTLNAGANTTVIQNINLNSTKISLWSPATPTLFTVTSSLQNVDGTSEIDSVVTTFGIRKIRLDANNGFYLNERVIKIRGMCNHQDFAGTGTAVPDRVNEYRVRKLLEMGANAWRMSHNPPNPELLDFTDKLGMLVWDENRNFADNAQYLTDMGDMVKRDRNHPSIVIWSLCNEGGCMEGNSGAYNVALKFISVIKQYDSINTRPVSAAQNGDWENNGEISLALDILGINYNIGMYDKYHTDRPTQPIIGSETSSQVTDRGIYVNNATAGYVWGYDIQNSGVSWGSSAEASWQPIAARNFVEGGFVWTGFDYKGEPTPYGWPDINSHFGVIDIAGFPKDVYWFYQVNWPQEKAYRIYLFPHWNWPAGSHVDTWAFTNAESVELFLNGASLGKKTQASLSHVNWNVTWATGTIEARAYVGDSVVVSATRVTTGSPAAIVLKERVVGTAGIRADGQDVAMVEVSVVDTQGRIVPTASNFITFSVSGPGRVYGVGNGDPASHEPDKATTRSVWNGLALVHVQSTGTKGTITLTATATGLTQATVQIAAS